METVLTNPLPNITLLLLHLIIKIIAIMCITKTRNICRFEEKERDGSGLYLSMWPSTCLILLFKRKKHAFVSFSQWDIWGNKH